MNTTRCPRCRTELDEGPVLYRCSRCCRAVYAAELDHEITVSRALRPLAVHG
jgi:tRNA(Ile2) C34 agmatinyltransferase TiaS